MKVNPLIIRCMKTDDVKTARVLDYLKGSYAVEYVLKALLRKQNKHTLRSMLKLINFSRKKDRDA